VKGGSRTVGEPAETMTEKDEILAAIAALGTDLRTEMRNNHADVMGKIDVIANGTGRMCANCGSILPRTVCKQTRG
jgi:hypothetical protein